MRADRVHPLDSLRGIAALGVTLFWHYAHFGPDQPFDDFVTRWLYRYGLMLVDFFFVLSGFVLSHVYLRRLAERRVTAFQFFILRFSRLYPLHLLTLVFVMGMQLFRGSQGLGSFVYGANDLQHFLLNLGFVQYGIIHTEYSFNGPAWSLTVEELSYLLYFVSLFFFAASYRLAFLVLVLLGSVINLANWDTHVFNLDVSRGLVGFFSGCLAHQLHRYAGQRGWSRLLAAAAGLFLAGLVFHYVRTGYPRSSLTLLAHSLAIFPAVVLTVLNSPPLARAFSLRPLTYLGEISYSIYMIHFPVQIVLATVEEVGQLDFARGSIPFFLVYASITLALSAASFHFFERRVQAAIRRSFLHRNRSEG